MSQPIRVLLAEDSPFLCRLLESYLVEAGGFSVVGKALTGLSAIALAKETRPDVMALDLTMPDVDGLTVLREVLRHRPLPVVIITGASGTSALHALQALDAGAVDFIFKFDPNAPVAPEALRQEIVTKLRRAARGNHGGKGVHLLATGSTEPLRSVVVAGASTGGPGALRLFLAELPTDLPAAVVIVQHVPAAFSGALAQDLARICRLPVAEYRTGERLQAGTVRVVPGGRNLLLQTGGAAALREASSEGHSPCIDVTMESAAEIFGPAAIGVLFTGMGEDGVDGLTAIRHRGGLTLAQEPSSCVVPAMPNAAIRRGIVDQVGLPVALAALVRRHLVRRSGAVYVA